MHDLQQVSCTIQQLLHAAYSKPANNNTLQTTTATPCKLQEKQQATSNTYTRIYK
jgi:hypothetical protein